MRRGGESFTSGC